jgi:phosphopantetheine--protein transferase-like protein
MIAGIGIDSVEIERFAQWHCWPSAKLLRIFSQQEIDYCLATPACNAQRFAARFAAREALYKALTQAQPEHTIPFLTLCRATTIAHREKKTPHLTIETRLLEPYGYKKNNFIIHLSLTHSNAAASAVVIIELPLESFDKLRTSGL